MPADGPRETQRAGDGTRTHDSDLGKVVLYQLSYTRVLPIAGGIPHITGIPPSKSRNYRFPMTDCKGNWLLHRKLDLRAFVNRRYWGKR